MPTDLAARAAAHAEKCGCELRGCEFVEGWDAAIASIRDMTPAQIADHRKPGITTQGEQESR